jgi:hypothetical protein
MEVSKIQIVTYLSCLFHISNYQFAKQMTIQSTFATTSGYFHRAPREPSDSFLECRKRNDNRVDAEGIPEEGSLFIMKNTDINQIIQNMITDVCNKQYLKFL